MRRFSAIFVFISLLLAVQVFAQNKRTNAPRKKKSTKVNTTLVCDPVPNVIDLRLDRTEIFLNCPNPPGSCTTDNIVEVKTYATDPEGSSNIYDYTVTGGKIIGNGAIVEWDLSGAPPGTYTITAGILIEKWHRVLGKTQTKTVTVNENLAALFTPANEPQSSLFKFNHGRSRPKQENAVPNEFANVTDLKLAKDIIVLSNCKAANAVPAWCSPENWLIEAETLAFDKEGDVMTYNYTISGGKINGQSSKVVWDLSGVPPGEYTITAAVDDGCGFCGKTVTKTVKVIECKDCK